MPKPRIYAMSFARVYPFYVTKAQKKGRTKIEVDLKNWVSLQATGYEPSFSKL